MLDPLETILRQCAEAAPRPWYPSEYAQTKGIQRDELDPHLDQLRMAGLIHLTDWVQGQGQGYALTPEGQNVLRSPRELARLRAGKLNNSPQVLQEPPYRTGPRVTPFERGEEIRAAFLYPSPPVVSFTLIFLNVAWFLPEILLSSRYHLPLNEFLVGYARQPAQQLAFNRVLIETGALSGTYILQGEWWRLVSCCFVHVGLIHLGLNMWALYVVGPFFEQLWGRGRFLVLYLIAGLGGSCSMVIAHPMNFGAGASGAIMGILTAHMVWILFNRRYLPPAVASQMLQRIVFILLIQVVFTHSVPNISAAAHYGGGAVGAVTAFLLNCHRFGGSVQRRLALLGLAAIPVLCVGAVAEAERIDSRWQQLQLEQIQRELEQNQCELEQIYREARMGAKQLLEAQVEPLQKQPMLSLQQVREASTGLGKARALVYDAMDRLKKAGPTRQPALEAQRQAYIQDLEKQTQRYELADLRGLVGLLLAREVPRAGRVYEEQHQALQKLDQEQLTPEVVSQAVRTASQARLEVAAALQLLRDTSPYRDQKLEKKRLALQDDIEEALRGWERTEERMRKMAKTAVPSGQSQPN